MSNLFSDETFDFYKKRGYNSAMLYPGMKEKPISVGISPSSLPCLGTRSAVAGAGPVFRRGGPRADVMCEQCKTIFQKHPCKFKKVSRHFCSRRCYGNSLIGTKQSLRTRKNRSLALSGEKGPNWNGGHSRNYRRGYKSEQYKHWRTEVFRRDKFKCRGCKTGGYLTAHHIKSFAKFPKLRYEVSNGLTLCEDCHADRDNYFKRTHPHRGGKRHGLDRISRN